METQKYVPKVIRRFPIIQLLATIFGSLSLLSGGMHYGWSSPSLPKLLNNDSSIILTKDEILWIPVAMPIGGFSGAILAAYMMNHIGRKHVLLFVSLPLTLSWLMIAQANSLSMLLAARFFGGLSSAIGMSALPIYVAEISTSKARGFFVSSTTCIWIIGVLFMNTLGSYVTITTGAYIALTLPLLFFVTFVWMPESPYYLIMKGKTEQARRSIAKLIRDDDKDMELNRLCTVIKERNDTNRSYKDLLKNKANIKSLFIMMGTRGAQQFCGMTCLMFYAQVIFEEAGDVISPKTSSIIYFGLYLIACGLATAIVDKTGRKPLLVISIVGVGIALFTEACYFYVKNKTDIDTTGYSLIPTLGLIIYITTFSMGMQSIPLLIAGEIFPSSIRSTASSFSTIYYYACGIISVQIFQFTIYAYGLHIPFFIFFICSILGLLFILFYVPETTGLTLEEIEDKLNND